MIDSYKERDFGNRFEQSGKICEIMSRRISGDLSVDRLIKGKYI